MSNTFQVNDKTIAANRIFCIGRNYVAHVQELNNELPNSPVVFMKPASSLVLHEKEVKFPAHGSELHHEVEVVALIGQGGKAQSDDDAMKMIAGLTLGVDLTLRDVQSKLKGKGLPWEIAKAFDSSALIGEMTAFGDSIDLSDISFSCLVNEELRQQGNTSLMIFPIPSLIVHLSKIWELQPGDLIYTGTPAGVGALHVGDQIRIESDLLGKFEWHIS